MENHYEGLEVESGDSDLELGRDGVADKDNNHKVVEIKPLAAVRMSLSKGIGPMS